MGGLFAGCGLARMQPAAPERMAGASAWRGSPEWISSDTGFVGIWGASQGEISLEREGRFVAAVHGSFFGSAPESAAGLLIEAWRNGGAEEAARLDGEFAWLLLDGDVESGTLALSRDAFGTRPLFFANDGDRFAAASTISAVRAAGFGGAGPDLEVLRRIARGGPGSGVKTAWRGVRRVLPGEIVVVGAGGVDRPVSRWTPRTAVRWDATASDAEAEIPADLRRAISRRRWVRPVLALGGGLDSTSIAALVWGDARLEGVVCGGESLLATTLSFPGRRCDETVRVEALAHRYRRDVGFCDASGADVISESTRLAAWCEEPLPGETGYQLPLIAKRAREAGGRTIVFGFGGDELFTGAEWAGAEALQRGRVSEARRVAAAWIGRATVASLWRGAVRPLAAQLARRGGERVSDSAAWQMTWRSLRAIYDSSIFEAVEGVLARESLTFSAPLLDRELFAAVMSRPFGLLAPNAGYKELLLSSVREALPKELLDGRRTVFDEEVDEAVRNAESTLGPRTQWAARDVLGPSVERRAARWGALAVELWWRAHLSEPGTRCREHGGI